MEMNEAKELKAMETWEKGVRGGGEMKGDGGIEMNEAKE